MASIKPNNAANGLSGMRPQPGGRFTASRVTLKFMITQAYHVKDFQVSGGANWMDSDSYNIDAKGDPNATTEQMWLMVQSLLADRFQLKMHRDTKEFPVYELVAGKTGRKLEEASGDIVSGGGTIENGEIAYSRINMSGLAQILSTLLNRPVTDKTGLTRNFALKLDWEPNGSAPGLQRSAAPEIPPASDLSGPSIFTAIQEQLGLKLESSKALFEVFVIDQAETPSEINLRLRIS